MGQIQDPNSESEDETGSHWQIITAKPGEIAGANVGNAYRMLGWFKKYSKKYPEDFISVPGQLSGIKGGAISSSGCKEYYIRFRTQDQQQANSQEELKSNATEVQQVATEAPSSQNVRPQDMPKYRKKFSDWIESQRNLNQLKPGKFEAI